VIARQEQLTAHESLMEQFFTEEKAMKGLIPGDDCFFCRALTALCELQNYLAGCRQDSFLNQSSFFIYLSIIDRSISKKTRNFLYTLQA
jgi:hypothetical protein